MYKRIVVVVEVKREGCDNYLFDLYLMKTRPKKII
jgi:hypothetical protein